MMAGRWNWCSDQFFFFKFVVQYQLIDSIIDSWSVTDKMALYRVSQKECARLRHSVPYVELYRYNPKHLYPKLNGYGDNGQRSLKLWQLLLTYWLTNTYWNGQEYVVSVMLISVLIIKVTCEWQAIKLYYKNTRNTVVFVLRLPSTSRRSQLTVILWRQSYRAVKHSPRSLHEKIYLAGLRSGSVLHHGRRTVRGHHRSPHFSMAINSVTVQLWI